MGTHAELAVSQFDNCSRTLVTKTYRVFRCFVVVPFGEPFGDTHTKLALSQFVDYCRAEPPKVVVFPL